MTENEKFLAPRTLEEAAQVSAKQDVMILAGGTDVLPRWSRGLVTKPEAVVSLKRVKGLDGVSRTNGQVCIGACTALSKIAADPIIREAAAVLAEAAGRIACPQVRNRATLGGNLCNASPAADTAVPLILLDAVLDLASASRRGVTVREVPIADFFCGPGSTVLAPGEILTRIRFKPLPEGVYAAWDKFGTRPAMEIAVASVGVAVKVEGERVTHARVGYGSVAPVPLRGRKTEAQLVGKPLSGDVIGKCEAAAREEIAPITDVRASEAYRREVVGVMLGRMLERAGRG
jgi:CO/xanthine dehydrogenase FAD-binding subunit